MSLSRRERTLLTACLVTLFLVANVIGLQIVISGFVKATSELDALEAERLEQLSWLSDADDVVFLDQWFRTHMPELESSSRAQSELLERMQTSTYENKLELERQQFVEPEVTDHYQEIAVNLRVHGELESIENWLTTLQQTAEFHVIRNLSLALDTRSKEKEPFARANLTIARWYRPLDMEQIETAILATDEEPEVVEPTPEVEPSPSPTLVELPAEPETPPANETGP